MPAISLSKIWQYWTDVHLCIVKLESRGQQLPVIEKNCSGNRFSPEKSSFFLKVLKTCFYPNHRMLNSYTFVLSRIKMKSIFLTINKRKNLCIVYPMQPEKIIFWLKNHKNTVFDLKCAILNRYAYESRKMEMINSEVIRNWRNS